VATQSFTITAAGDTTLVAGVGGQQIRVVGINLSISGNTGYEVVPRLKDSAGGTSVAVAPMGVENDYFPFSLPVGLGLVFHIDDPVEVKITLTYTQV